MTTAEQNCGEYDHPIYFELIDDPKNAYARNAAADICGPCPIRDTCLPKNMKAGGYDQVWADAVARELVRRQRKAAAGRESNLGTIAQAVVDYGKTATIRTTCGSLAGYSSHLRHQEPACEPCRLVHNEQHRKRTAKRKAMQAALTMLGTGDEIAWERDMHAAHYRHKTAGGPIPEDVLAGERAYQARRARKRRSAA